MVRRTVRVAAFFKRLASDVSLAAILAYVIILKLSIPILWAPGIILVFYLPGWQITRLWPRLVKPWGKFGRLALRIFLSVSFFSTLLLAIPLVSRSPLSLAPHYLHSLLIGSNIILGAAILVWRPAYSIAEWWRSWSRAFNRRTLGEASPLLLFLLILTVIVLLNPYAQNADGYLDFLRESIMQGKNILRERQLFVALIAFLHHELGINYVWLYRVFFVVLFWISTFFLFDYARQRLKHPMYQLTAYLSLVGAAVILTEVNIIRPQVVVISFTLPILLFIMRSIEERDWVWSVIALWFSAVAFGAHDLGLILALLAGVGIIYNLFLLTIIEKKITWKHYVLFVLVVLPYLKILPLGPYFSYTFNLIRFAVRLFDGVHWEWWFIDNYQTVDGTNLGWPGLQAAYYYLYNGILLFGTVVVGALWSWRHQRRIQPVIWIPFLYATIFFIFAEILPRMGFFFFPNRAWVHLMMALPLLVVVFLVTYEQWRPTPTRFIKLLLSGVIVSGMMGAIYVGINNVSVVFPQELAGMHYLRVETPPNSVILSSQYNETLVETYGQRSYLQIEPRQKFDIAAFNASVETILTEASNTKIKILVPEVKQNIRTYYDGVLTSDITRVIQLQERKEIRPIYHAGTPVYFVYSRRKISGLNGQRSYLAYGSDSLNRETYLGLGFPVVFQDDSILILKLR